MRLLPVVAIPARNEAERLSALLAALAGQTFCRTQGPLQVVLVLNNTSDGSAEVVRSCMDLYPELRVELIDVVYPGERAHVGSARREAMERAADHIVDGDGVILTTDADAVPHPGWVEHNLAAIAKGADLVGGKIFGDPAEEAALGAGFLKRAREFSQYQELCDELTALIDPIAHDPWPRHQDHTGASLAVRASVYRAVGGMPAVAFREDLGFVDRVVSNGYRLVHPREVEVTVSARLHGRAPGGMADCIASWVKAEAEHKPVFVEDPAAVELRAFRRARIRALLGQSPARWQSTLSDLGASPGMLAAMTSSAKDIARLIQALAPNEPDARAEVPIGAAITQILRRIDLLQSGSNVA